MDLYMSAFDNCIRHFPPRRPCMPIGRVSGFLVEAVPYRRSAYGALAPDSRLCAARSDDPLATANDAFGLTLGLESISLYGRGAKPEYPGEESI